MSPGHIFPGDNMEHVIAPDTVVTVTLGYSTDETTGPFVFVHYIRHDTGRAMADTHVVAVARITDGRNGWARVESDNASYTVDVDADFQPRVMWDDDDG